MAVVEMKLENLRIHPRNVRKEYEGIDELAQSIKENGIMQNLTVVPDPNENGKYLVVIGNRRLTAARQAGIDTAPCVIIEDMSDKDQVTTMLTENMNRKDLKIYEESAAIQMCFADFGLSMEELGEKTGLSRTTLNHRLSIAKLNEKVLREKTGNGEFQLSLTDLYSLEKVESVKTRNKILKEATDSMDLANRVRSAVREELQAKNEKEFIALCNKRGIKAAPKEADNELYSEKWERIVYYSLTDKVPKQLKIGKDGEFFYLTKYGTFYIIKKVDTKNKVLTEREIKEKEDKKRKNELKAKYKAMFEDMGDFVRSIFDGKVKPVKDVEKLDQMTWNLFMCDSTWIMKNDLTCTILGKELYANGITAEERKAAEEKAAKLSILNQKLAVAYWKLRDLNLTDWDGTYNSKSGEKLDRLYDILAIFGFSYADEESYKVANGEHELYVKKDEGQKK